MRHSNSARSARALAAALAICCAAAEVCLAASRPALARAVNQEAPGAAAQDWQSNVRALAAQREFARALEAVDARLAAAPADLEARGWRGRLLGWMGRFTEAEAEFRAALAAAPQDADLLLGLAGVLAAQQRNSEALALLDQARSFAPAYADVHLARGRVLRSLGRRSEAREAFRQALRLQPKNAEARQGLESVAEEPRHQFVAGADFDSFNFTSLYGRTAYATLRTDWSSKWISVVGARFDLRGGQTAGRGLAAVTFRPSRRDAFTAGGSAARDQGVVSRGELFIEYARGLRLSETRFLRGLEAGVQQKWLWFDAARILTLTPSVLLYLPRDWTWSLQVTAARSRFPGTGAEWRPSGVTRLSFPVQRRVTANAFFAVGTENYALAEQIGRFSARTWGGGARVTLTRRSDLSFYFAWQDRSQGRVQKSFGLAYGIRF